MKKTCITCNKEINVLHFHKDSPEQCVFCYSETGVKSSEIKKYKDYEVVEDKGCAGGACTL